MASVTQIILPPSYTGGGGGSPVTFDYYISPTGSDSNPGTLASPWAITALATKTSSITNKTVGLLDGTYIVTPSNSGGNNTGGIQWNAAGCTIKAVNPRQAVVTTNNAGSYPQWTDPAIQVMGANSVVDGIKFYQSSFDFLRITGTGSVIKNCHFEDVQLSRISGYPQGDNIGALTIGSGTIPTVTVDNCYFNNILNGNASENSCCIGPIYHGGNTTITRCGFFNSVVGIGWKSYNNGPLTVTSCYFDATISKLAVYGGMSNDYVVPMQFTFKNNVVNRPAYALDIWQINDPHSENWTDIQHNTFVMSTNLWGVSGIAYGNGLGGPVLSGSDLHHCILRDNVFMGDAGVAAPVLYFETGRNSSLDLFGIADYNMYSYLNMHDADGVTYSTLANWQARTGQESHSLNASATFVNSTGGTPASYALASGFGRNAASDGTDIGAWGGGVTQIGFNF